MGGRGSTISEQSALDAPADYAGPPDEHDSDSDESGLRDDLARENYEIETHRSKGVGIDRAPLDQTGRRWRHITRSVDEVARRREEAFLIALEQGEDFDPLRHCEIDDSAIHPDDRFGMSRPTLRTVKDGKVHDIFIEGMSWEAFQAATGYEVDLFNVNKLGKRASRTLRAEPLNATFSVTQTMTTPDAIPDDPLGLGVLENLQVISDAEFTPLTQRWQLTGDGQITGEEIAARMGLDPEAYEGDLTPEFTIRRAVAAGRADVRLQEIDPRRIHVSELDPNYLIIEDERGQPAAAYNMNTGRYQVPESNHALRHYNQAALADERRIAIAVMMRDETLQAQAAQPGMTVQHINNDPEQGIQYVFDAANGVQYTRYADNALGPSQWDGAGVVSRKTLKKMIRQMHPDLAAAKRDKLVHELTHSGRVEFTINTRRGQEKGHAIVSEKPLDVNGQVVDFLLPEDAKHEAKWGEGRDAHMTIKFPHGSRSVYGDIQSLTNNGMGVPDDQGFFNSQNLSQWMYDDYHLVTTAWQNGDIQTVFERLGDHTTLDDITGYPLYEYAAMGGQPEYSSSLLKKNTEVFQQRYSQEQLYDKPRIPMPGGRYYIMPEKVANVAGSDYDVKRGEIYVDPDTNSAYVNDLDWVQLQDTNPENPHGIADILGGADNDDALVVHPFLDRQDGKQKYLIYRNPNQSGEYVALEPAAGSDPLPWKTASGERITWIENDSARLPDRIDYRDTRNLDLIKEKEARSDNVDGDMHDSMWHALDRAVANGQIIGMASNQEIAHTAVYHEPPHEIVAAQEDIIDAQKDGSDASAAAEALARKQEQIWAENHTQIPDMLRGRVWTRYNTVAEEAGLADIMRSGSPLQIAYTAAMQNEPGYDHTDIPADSQAMTELIELGKRNPEKGQRIADTVRDLRSVFDYDQVGIPGDAGQVLHNHGWIEAEHVMSTDHMTPPNSSTYSPWDGVERTAQHIRRQSLEQQRDMMRRTAPPEEVFEYLFSEDATGQNRTRYLEIGSRVNQAYNGYLNNLFRERESGRTWHTDEEYEAAYQQVLNILHQYDRSEWADIALGAWVSPHLNAPRNFTEAARRGPVGSDEREAAMRRQVPEANVSWQIGFKDDATGERHQAFYKYTLDGLRKAGIASEIEVDPATGQVEFTRRPDLIDPERRGIMRVDALWYNEMEQYADRGITPGWSDREGWQVYAEDVGFTDDLYDPDAAKPPWKQARRAWLQHHKRNIHDDWHINERVEREYQVQHRYDSSKDRMVHQLVDDDGHVLGRISGDSQNVFPGDRVRLQYTRHDKDGNIQVQYHRLPQKKVLATGSQQARSAGQAQRMMRQARAVVAQAQRDGTQILVGDAPQGVDRYVVDAANAAGYHNVVVVGTGQEPRNGGVVNGFYEQAGADAKTHRIQPAEEQPELDRYLTRRADEGVFIWNGDDPRTETGYVFMGEQDKPVTLHNNAAILTDAAQHKLTEAAIDSGEYIRWCGAEGKLTAQDVTRAQIQAYQRHRKEGRRQAQYERHQQRTDQSSPFREPKRVTEAAQAVLDEANIDRRYFAAWLGVDELTRENTHRDSIARYNRPVDPSEQYHAIG